LIFQALAHAEFIVFLRKSSLRGSALPGAGASPPRCLARACWAGPWRSSNLPGKVDDLVLQTESHNALDSEKFSKEIWRLDKRILSGSSATFLGGGGCGGGVGRKGRIICFICTLFAALWATVPRPLPSKRSRTALVGLRRHAEPLLWAWAAHPIDPPAGILCPVESSLRWEDNSYLAGIRTVPLS